MAHYYPPVAFHFRVEVLDLPPSGNDARFSEAGGLQMEAATEEVPEGGENRYIQKYPVRAKYPELVLKRGLLVGSELLNWARECIQELKITPKNVDVSLLNAKHEPLMTWHLVNAYPTKWTLGDLNAMSNAFALESLQLFYQYFTVDATVAVSD